MMRAAAIALAMLVACPAAADVAAQTANSSTVAGVVLDAVSNQPIGLALITLQPLAAVSMKRIHADESGRFLFHSVVGGSYLVFASRPGYVSTQYGATRPGGPGRPIEIGAGQPLTTLQIRLAPGGVVAGTVRRANGEPAAQTSVVLRRWSQSLLHAGNGPTTIAGSVTTDDRGQYRLFGVAAGEYVVSAIGSREEVDGEMSRDAELFGLRQITHADVDAALGRVPTAPSLVLRSASEQRVRSTRPVMTYFPGTTRAGEASVITVVAGKELSGLDFSLMQIQVATVSGRLVVAEESVERTRVQLVVAEPGGAPSTDIQSAAPAGDGTFIFLGVAPGRYAVAGQVMLPTGETRTAIEHLVVSGEDVRDLTLEPKTGLMVSGRVALREASAGAALPPNLRVALTAVVADGEVNIAPAPAAVDDAGRFSFKGVVPGRYLIEVAGDRPSASPGVWLRSARVGDLDATDRPVVISTAIDDMTLTVVSRPAAVAGSVREANGQPAARATVLFFSIDPAQWQRPTRRVIGLPVMAGAFESDALPPGEYFVAAVSDQLPGQGVDRPYLDGLASSAQRVLVVDGARISLELVVK